MPDDGSEKLKYVNCCMASKCHAVYLACISAFMYSTGSYCWLCPYIVHTLQMGYSINSYDLWGMWFSIWENLMLGLLFSTIFIILMMYAILLGSKNSLSTRQKYHQNSILKHYCYFSLVSVTVLELICIMIHEFSKTLQFHCQVHNFFYK